ncbi:MAG: ABC transporter ATP-binding protein [Elusimicrobia bacterium]|nr:ABC transporter ATP-binding protein [Elusimicrobiota bacterium]
MSNNKISNWLIFKRLGQFVKPYKCIFIIGIICLSFVGTLMPSIITMVKPVMDIIFASSEVIVIPFLKYEIPRDAAVNFLALAIISLALLKGVFDFFSKYLMAYIGQHVTMDIRNRLFGHLVYQSLEYYSNNPTGQILSRITNDVKYLENSIVKIPARFVRDGLMLIILLGMIIFFNPKWALMTILGFLLIILPLVLFSKMLRNLGRKGQQRMADIYDFLSEKISGVRLVKSFSMEKEEQKEMEKANKRFISLVLKSEKIDAFQGAFIEFLAISGVALAIVTIGGAVIRDSVTPGDFFLLLGYIVALYTPAKNFAGLNQELQKSLAAAERIFEILDEKSPLVERSNLKILKDFNQSLEFRDVSYRYGDGDLVLKNININVPHGSIAAVVGPSGAGKSTLINLVPRFFDPVSGFIAIDGKDIREYTVRSLRKKIAMVMQDVILFNMSVKDNICYGLGEFSDDEVRKYAEAAYADMFIKQLPDGYDTIVGEKGVKLSGGQKQRISIARALIKDPEILILDEATSHLDTESEKLVQDALDLLMKNRTTLVIAHRLSTVRNADKIIVLEDGKVREEGRHEELLAIPGLYRRMFEMQSI